ncbi:asparagine-rich protein-like isoform X2 [Drosophila mauritiana]|uniref:Asparagine-rich protein-like isoform X2 n=1 Tax=Drosophila mauritiana TaxID=7226 RepID=A0A6P8LBA0_DROMA|nr:asparagine-rich protein-like isoform X2 [Drosophila mauritiana]
MTKSLECVRCCPVSSSSIETTILCDKWCPFICNRQCTTSYFYGHGYSMLKRICHKIIQNYNRKQCRESYTVFDGGNSTKDRPLIKKYRGNFESYGLKKKEKYDDVAGIENESQKKRDILKKLQSPKARIRRGYREVNDFIISRRISGEGAHKRGWDASEVDNDLNKNTSLEWNIKKNKEVKKKNFNEFYKKGVQKKTGNNGIDMHLNENDAMKFDKNKGQAVKKMNENGKDRRGKNYENNLNEHINEKIKKKNKTEKPENYENNLNDNMNEKIKIKSKTEKPDSNHDAKETKPLNLEKNKKNFDLKLQIKIDHGDSDFNDQSNEQIKWDLGKKKINRSGKSVKNPKNIEVDSETTIIKKQIRGNETGKYAITDKTQGSRSKNKTSSKAAEGVLNRVKGRYRCKSLGYMQENLRFGRLVKPSDMLRVKLEERDLCRCIPCCNCSLYQTFLPNDFMYQCCGQ